MFLPGFHPVPVWDRREDRRGQRLDHAQIVERLFQLLARLFEFFVGRQIGTDGDRSDRRAFIFVVREVHGLFGGHAIGCKARQHVCDSFSQFAVNGQGNFEPIIHVGVSLALSTSISLAFYYNLACEL